MSAPGTNKVDLTFQSDVAIVTLDHFPVNTLTNAVQLGIEESANKIKSNSNIKAVVLKGAGSRAFCAGADIQDLNRKHDRYPEKPFMEYFEDLNVPVVALLQGFTLGGGFELSLGAHYRVITRDGVVGLPEVNIGLLPGGQGTQRLPRLIGVEAALKVMMSGEHIPASAALKYNIVDKILDSSAREQDDLLKEAIQFALSKSSEDLSKRRISALPAPKYDGDIMSLAKKARRGKKEIAHIAIAKCVEAASKASSFQEGFKFEQEEFKKLLVSPQARGLQHIFFAERAAAKIPVKAKPAKVTKIGVLGAGTMGGGIAMNFANIGIKVLLLDRTEKDLERGMKVISGNYKRSVSSGSKSQQFVDKALACISTTTKYEDMNDVDLVIEAVFEDLSLKKEIFAKLDKICKKDCILASNTSYLDIDAMAASVSESRRSKVVGMHFFSPANVMKLLENIRGKDTDAVTLTTVTALGQAISKWPVLVRNRHGFVGNRMLAFYSTEARGMLMEGAELVTIDKVAKEFGMLMGPFEMSDLVGLDIGYQAREKSGNINPKGDFTDALIGAGRLGMKNNKGFYEYEGRDRKQSEEANKIINSVRAYNKKEQLKFTDKEIEERLFFPIINEGFKVLEEKVAEKPSDIDTVYVHGYNWPRVTGGPMCYADTVGLKKVLETLQKYEKRYPKAQYFKPALLLQDCVKSSMSLEQFWKKNAGNYKWKEANTSNL